MIRHPILLPRYSHITKLVIRHNHENTHHQGRGITSYRIRTDGYWIIGGSRAVSSYIFKCVVCRRSRGVPATQKMAPLPAVRLGLDCFGPFLVKEGRRTTKKLVYVCCEMI